jgi:hypothetical protein
MPKRFQLPVPPEFLAKRDMSIVSANQAAEVFSLLQGRMSAELHETMRLLGGPLKPKHRRTLANLIITKIYQRDMVERLISEKVLPLSDPRNSHSLCLCIITSLIDLFKLT